MGQQTQNTELIVTILFIRYNKDMFDQRNKKTKDVGSGE